MKRLALAGLALIPTLVMLCCGAEVWSETPAPAVAEAKPAKPQMFGPGAFDNPKVCSTCHSQIYEEWSKSMHAYAWTDQWYQHDFLLAHQQTNGGTDILCGAGKVVFKSGHVDSKNYVDPNAVFFRVLFRDAEGKLTNKSWLAHGIGYDRRIPAKGKDTEVYRIPLPAKGEYKVTTRLMYRSMTQESLDDIFERTGKRLPPVVSVEMASAQTKVQR